jgi:peroxiredoxin
VQLVELQKSLAEFQAQGARILAIAPDAPERLTKMVADLGLGFPVLRDAELATIEAWGIRNAESPTLPHPTVAIVDKQGHLRWFHLDEDYRRRPPVADLLAALKALGDSDAEAGKGQ